MRRGKQCGIERVEQRECVIVSERSMCTRGEEKRVRKQMKAVTHTHTRELIVAERVRLWECA